MTNSDSMYTTKQVAKILGVTARTVQLWAENGVIEAWKTPGGHRRIRQAELDKLIKTIREPAKESSSSGDCKLLLVEDETDLLKLYRMHFESWNLPIEVLTATDGYEALIRIGAEKPDMIITDLNMPHMNGFHMLKILQGIEELNGTDVVVVTALSKEEIADNGGLPDGISILHKPVQFEELESLVRKKYNQVNELRATG